MMIGGIGCSDAYLSETKLSDCMKHSLDEHATPFIEIDEHKLEHNLRAGQRRADSAGAKLRPHIKTHKSLEIARRQVAIGAVGLTASKPSEALVFVEGGFEDVTVAYPIVHADRIDDLLSVAHDRHAQVRFIVSDAVGLSALETAAKRHGTILSCYLKVDVGLGRVGVDPNSSQAISLARSIHDSSAFQFEGLLSHAGHAYAMEGPGQIADVALREFSLLSELRSKLSAAGIAPRELSTGSTPTAIGSEIPRGTTEIRPGNYAFFDLTALRLKLCGLDDLALSVVATVIAVNDRHAVIDAGSKALSSDRGPHGTGAAHFGLVQSLDGSAIEEAWTVARLSEEHGFVATGNMQPVVGDRVRIFPNHSCAVAAQFRSFVMAQADGTRTVYPIDAHACLT